MRTFEVTFKNEDEVIQTRLVHALDKNDAHDQVKLLNPKGNDFKVEEVLVA